MLKRKLESSGPKNAKPGKPEGKGGFKKASFKKPDSSSKPENPFETIRARAKHNVLGRDNRGTVRNVVKARSKAIAARQASLLQEFQQSNKSGKFVDSRIGADDEEGPLKRFQEERQRRLNKAKRFALEEEEANAETLTHGGRPISLTEAESNAGATAFSDDEEEDEAETAANFGGGADGPKGDEERRAARSTKEVMEEVIAKSKMFKLEKQEAAKQQEERLLSLDGDLSGIRGLLQFTEKKKKIPDDPMALLAQIRAEGKPNEGGKQKEEEEEEEDEFSIEARKLAQESRAQASDRLKTPEETAKEEHAQLQRLEAARIRRMNGEVVEEEEEMSLAPTGGYAARRAKAKAELAQAKERQTKVLHQKKLPRTDEDLDGNFEVDTNLNVISEAEEDDDDGDDNNAEEEEEDEESEEEEDVPTTTTTTTNKKSIESKTAKVEKKKFEEKKQETKQQPRSEGKVEIKSSNESKLPPAKKQKPSETKVESKVGVNDSLPFVFEVPADYSAFTALLSPHSRKDQGVILRRMIACHNLALGPEKRPLLERLYSLLMDHFRFLTLAATPDSTTTSSSNSSSSSSSSSSTPSIPLSSVLSDLDLVTTVLWELSQMLPKFVGRFHRGYLIRVRKNLTAREREISPQSSSMPSFHHLLYFKLLSAIFPVSDFRHHVVTPAMLMMGECLGRVPVKGGRDVAAGLFLADLMVNYIKDSKRLIPELLVFLQGLLEQGFSNTPSLEGVRLNMNIPSLFAGITGNEKKEQVPLSMLLGKDNSGVSPKGFPAACFVATLALVRKVHALYSSYPSSPELFKGIEDALRKANVSGPESKATLDELAKEHKKVRVPLAHVIKPPTIKQFSPAFEEDFRPGKDYDPSAQRSEIRKLSKKLKKEKRGAIKELRRDTAFLANEKRKISEKMDKRSADHMKRVRQDLEAQQKDTNYFQREGKKKRGKK